MSIAEVTLPVSATPGIPMRRVVSVEVRKLVDTRAGRWLLIAIAVITLAVVVVVYLTVDPRQRTFATFTLATGAPQGFLLPVLGIMSVTGEWTQRTALVSFTLVPGRGRIVAAKTMATVLVGLAALVLALTIAALATVLGGESGAWRGFGTDTLGKLALLQVIGVLQGLAFGLLFLNTAAAIVTYYVVPNAFTLVSGLWTALAHAQPWIDLNVSQGRLFDGSAMAGRQWAQLATGVTIWVLVPFMLGVYRVLRAEVK
jgi:ABC-2 type transport system permease protein